MARKRKLMCAYGDCQETMVAGESFKLTVTETRKGSVYDRQSYCCLEHAWCAIKARDERLNGKRELA